MTVDRCPCGILLTSLRTWRIMSEERRERHIALRDLAPHMGKGLCRPCYNRARHVPRARAVAQRCIACETPVIPASRWRAMGREERRASGARSHQGRGYCSRCYKTAEPIDVEYEVMRLRVIGLSVEQIASEVGVSVRRVLEAA